MGVLLKLFSLWLWPSYCHALFMHVLDYILGRLSGLFRFNNYSLLGRLCFVYVVGLSLRDLFERYYGF
jgi:hypothetical protein